MTICIGVQHLSNSVYDYAYRDNVLTDEEIEKLVTLVENNLPVTDAKIGMTEESGIINDIVRKTSIRWIQYNNTSAELFTRMASVVDQMNAQYFGYDLTGFDVFQYSEYHDDGGHYDFHVDMYFGRGKAPNGHFHRKLSFALLLTDPSEFDGGLFQIQTGGHIHTVEQKKGRIIAFPSYILHRVTPVTSGVRKSLVFWIEGPRFK